MDLNFIPKQSQDKYVYYSPGVIVPVFEFIKNDNNTTTIHDIIDHLIDLGRLPKQNLYYKKYAPEYIQTYAKYFGNEQYMCCESEYYEFFKSISDKLTENDSCRNISTVKDDLLYLKSHDQIDIEKLITSGTNIVYTDNRYKVYAIKSYDSMRGLMCKTYSCFASEDTNCFKGYTELGAICYVIIDSNAEHKTQRCMMNLICKELEWDTWINSNGVHLLQDKYVTVDNDGNLKHTQPTELSIDSIKHIINTCKHHINSHYNEHHDVFTNNVVTDKIFFNTDLIRNRYNENLHYIKQSHNITLQQGIYKKILNKFSDLETNAIYNKIVSEYKNFNKAYFAKVPPSEVQIHGLWRFWLIDDKLDNIDIDGNLYRSSDFFPNTYKIIHDIDKSTEHQGVLSFGLSILKPNCFLNAHTGYFNNMPHNCVFRIHLPLDVPESDYDVCGLNLYENIKEPGWGPPITSITRKIVWQEQKLLVFDDSFKHEAWNKSAKSRAVLIIDYIDNNMLVNKLTARNPLTGEISNIRTLAKDWHQFFIDDLKTRNHIQEHVNEIKSTFN